MKEDVVMGIETYQHTMKSRLSIHRPLCQSFHTLVVPKWIRDIAIVREQRGPSVDSIVIDHAYIEDVGILVQKISDLLL
jgi:hypothetical protein